MAQAECNCQVCNGGYQRLVDIATKPSNPNPKDVIGSGKLPLSLVPGTTKAYLALGHAEGHLKYGLVNWREAGVRTSVYLDACERHLEKFKNGEWADPVTKVPHLANALCCLSIIVDAHECGKLIDDRPKGAPVADLIDSFADNIKHLKGLFSESRPVDYFIDGPKQRAEARPEDYGAGLYYGCGKHKADSTARVCPYCAPGLSPDDRYMD